MNLFPRDEKFFQLLEQQSNLIHDAAQSLRQGVRKAAASAMAFNAGVIKPHWSTMPMKSLIRF